MISGDKARAERVRQRAVRLWEDAGRPETGPQAYEGRADELISMEEAPDGGDTPVAPYGGDPGVEPLEAVENQGEFPTLTDQGEDSPVPLRRGERRKRLD
ncbi:DUF2934 domain-containing protein [Glycocaulis profundi]|nr:DUF2934 domain-containing protein [Glycocaulis profundi]